ncbi:hypothetical protein LZ32DRAFT_660338 [Colletotrichum eremochloae]|nr:hypothetical protein LZ32DRAFT_660338 [Colletotrichum eremochloae]
MVLSLLDRLNLLSQQLQERNEILAISTSTYASASANSSSSLSHHSLPPLPAHLTLALYCTYLRWTLSLRPSTSFIVTPRRFLSRILSTSFSVLSADHPVPTQTACSPVAASDILLALSPTSVLPSSPVVFAQMTDSVPALVRRHVLSGPLRPPHSLYDDDAAAAAATHAYLQSDIFPRPLGVVA